MLSNLPKMESVLHGAIPGDKVVSCDPLWCQSYLNDEAICLCKRSKPPNISDRDKKIVLYVFINTQFCVATVSFC